MADFNEEHTRICPECSSENIGLELFDLKTGDFTYYCYSCHYTWIINAKNLSSKTMNVKKLLPNKSKFNLTQSKEDRLRFNHLGKIKDEDIAEILLDLFETGGNKFYKGKKRYRRKKK